MSLSRALLCPYNYLMFENPRSQKSTEAFTTGMMDRDRDM